MIYFYFLIVLNLSITSRLGFNYDSNLFKYSYEEMNEYQSGINPQKFPIKSADDLEMRFSMTGSLKRGFSKYLNGDFAFSVSSVSYLNNKFKSYWSLKGKFLLRASEWKTFMSFEFLPNYTIRYYRPLGFSNYIPCEFSRQRVEFLIGRKVGKGGEIATSIGYFYDNYLKEFDYYDSHNLTVLLNTTFSIAKYCKPSFAYRFINSMANGPIPDISYYQHELDLGVSLIPKIKRVKSLLVEFGYSNRRYKTENSPFIDPFHSGRIDNTYQLALGSEVRLGLGSYALIKLSREWRNSSSENFGDIQEYKNYEKWRFGITISQKLI